MCFACLPAQSAQPEQERRLPSFLKVTVIEGEGAAHETGKPVRRPPLVQVSDENGQPVPGAAVQFRVPTRGPGGLFSGGGGTLEVRTGSDGRAAASGLRANLFPGKYQIEVLAVYEGMTASAVVHQMNVTSGGSASRKWIAVLAAAGGAAAVGIVLAGRKSSASPASQPPGTTISPGAPSVGGPP